jgi:hypothetical protein
LANFFPVRGLDLVVSIGTACEVDNNQRPLGEYSLRFGSLWYGLFSPYRDMGKIGWMTEGSHVLCAFQFTQIKAGEII